MEKNIPNNFLGIEEKYSAYNRAKFAVLPVPFEGTVSYGSGTALAPNAIITASQQVEFYDDELGFEPREAGIATLRPLEVNGKSAKVMSRILNESVAKIISDKKIPIVLGGEHSITPPIVEAVCKQHEITVVQFDAHADLREEYEDNPMSHACAMARVREFCPAVQIGIRSLTEEEHVRIKKEKLPVFFARDIRDSKNWIDKCISAISTEKVYVTFDVDAFDGSLLPATGTPEPGGMGWYDVTNFLKALCEKKKIVGLDFVELAPIEGMHAYDFMIAKLIYKSIGYTTKNMRNG